MCYTVAMRKLLSIVTIAWAIGALVLASPALASAGSDLVTGTGTLGQFGDPTVQVNAIQTGQWLQGRFTITYPDRTFATGSVTCLSVSGKTAYLTSRIILSGGPRQQSAGWFAGSYIVIGITDTGSGAAGPDLLNFSPGFATNPGCGPIGAATPVFPIAQGNFQVR